MKIHSARMELFNVFGRVVTVHILSH